MDQAANSRLLSAFPPHTHAAWKEAATELLKGRPFEKTLVTPTHEGFDLQPLYTREVLERLVHTGEVPGGGSRVRGSRVDGYLQSGWLVSQELTAPTPAALNAIALHALENGQDELNIWLDAPSRRGEEPGGGNADGGNADAVGRCGLSLATAADLRQLLAGVHPEMISLYLQSGRAAPAVYALLVAALREDGHDLSKVRGCLGMDPAGWLVETGRSAGDFEKVCDSMAAILRHAAANLPQLQVIDVQGHAYHNGGASSTQELAAVLATAVAYLKAMAERGVTAGEVVPRMRLSVSIGGNYFIEVAKLRALRLLWSRIMDAFAVPEAARAVHVHARTGLWNKTVFDPYVNLLRTTTEAFSAVVGGCDSLHVGPFDEVIRESDAFSRRIARNTHAILAEECDLRRVIDPAGGSWAVETLTDQMAAEAWKQFQGIEAGGGIVAGLESGILQEAVAAVRQAKAASIQKRQSVIVGTNAYPNAGEELLKPSSVDYAAACRERITTIAEWKAARDAAGVASALATIGAATGVDRVESMVQAAAAGATSAELVAALALGDGPAVQPIPLTRAAGDYEKLRLAAKALEAAGTPAVIHQLNMGPSRRYRIRADWTSAFFQVAGFQVRNQDDYTDVEAAVKALGQSGARVAVITSDDETYANVAEPLARAIKAASSGIKVLLAGAPGDREAALRAAGVDDFVHMRVNNYSFNRALLASLGAQL